MKDVLLVIAGRKLLASYEELAKITGCSRSSVAYAVAHAQKLGILECVKTRVQRGRRIVNGRNVYRFLNVVVGQRFLWPWRSKSKHSTTRNEESKKTSQKLYSTDHWLEILGRMDAGMSAIEAGYGKLE